MSLTRTARSFLLAGMFLAAAATISRGAAAAPEADREEPTESSLIERATTELVLIEAYVTDARGRALRGLNPDDFVLKVDRRRKPIGSLEFVEVAPEAAAPSRPSPEAPEATPTPFPVPTYPRRFVMFFEDAVSDQFALGQARRAAIDFLTTQLAADDQVSIVAYNSIEKMRVLHDFSTDRDSLREVIRESLENPHRHSGYMVQNNEHHQEIRRALREPSFGGRGGLGSTQAGMLATSFAREDIALMRPILTSLRVLVEALAPWPGYKAVILLGDGIPEYPREEYLRIAEESSNLSLDLMDLARAAATSRVSLHAIQTSGLPAGSGQLRRDWQRTNALKKLALNSGGLVSTSNDLLQGLVEVDTKSRAYYLVGYVPEGPPDGLYHSVTVKVKRSGARVRHRDGFRRLPPAEAHERTVQAAHLLPELYPQAGLELAIVPGPRSPSGRLNDLVLYVPASGAIFLPEEGSLTARLEFGIVVIDEKGKETYRVSRNIEIVLPPGTSPSDGLGLNLFSRVPLPARDQTITAVLADLQGGTIGAGRAHVSPAVTGDRRLSGLSIYSLAQSSLWIDVSDETSGDEPTGVLRTYERGPALKSWFTPDESVACGFRLPAGVGASAPRLQVLILRGEEIVWAKPVEPVEGKVPAGSVKVMVPVEGLASGDYFLLVREVTAGGNHERGRLPFHIVSANIR
jgi:VWFA-related protein